MRRVTGITIDPARLAFAVLAVLLIAGVIGFTATAVGWLLLASTLEFPITWNRR